ncbi:CDC27 family protein [Flavobacterium channae]|uniref:CDC27 family protein n=1 Tax=Flavobacterium channae TaxID=2897181 RepID=UPI001E5AE82F|nr:CDC27 family protein [Flavobacterium channae]UGS23003.1 CDC27 family protein [Flavobacterium channae]
MKIKILVFLMMTLVGFSQEKKINEEYNYINDYYQFVYQAHYSYLKGDYQKTYDLLKTAEKNCPLLNQTGIYEPMILAESAVKLGKHKEALAYIELTLKEFGIKFSYFENNFDFEELKSSKRWKKIKNKAEKYYKDYIQKIDFSLRKELNLMKKEDQRVRTNGFDAEGAKIVDSVNNEKLKRIVADCDCYPNYSLNLIGNYEVDEFDPDISVLIMHISSEDSEYWQPIFLDLIRRGRAPADIYGSLIDSNLRSNGIYRYGIYNNIKKDKIDDFENLDKRRIAVGLPPWQLQKDIFELIRKKYGF